MTKEQYENVKKWIAALRSGNYHQGQMRLKANVAYHTDNYAKRVPHYCCLGVACEVYQREGPGNLEVYEEKKAESRVGILRQERLPAVLEDISFNGCITTLPSAVKQWLNLRENNGSFSALLAIGNDRRSYSSLVTLNDRDVDGGFMTIADVIERELETNEHNLFNDIEVVE